MGGNTKRRKVSLTVGEIESLEGRELLAANFGFNLSGLPAGLISQYAGRVPSGVKTDPAAVAAILSALNGGPGSEFVSLIKNQVPNLNSVISGFVSGRRTEFTTPGIAAKIPNWNEAYTGIHYDHLTVTLAGAVLQGNTLQLGAVMRGLFDEAAPSQIVFGIDRGAGSRLGPIFGNRPGITPDALVTINVGPYGQNNTATVTDLVTGQTTTIDPSKIQVTGAVARVFVDVSLLPSQGLSPSQYKFAMWSRSSPDGSVENVGSFAPSSNMIQVGVPKSSGPVGRPRPRPRR